MTKSKPIVDKMLEQLEQIKISSLLNTDEKLVRFRRAAKSGYSAEFALIFALQEK